MRERSWALGFRGFGVRLESLGFGQGLGAQGYLG